MSRAHALSVFALLAVLAVLTMGACVSKKPALPDGGMVHGSNWIPSGTSASFAASEGPREVVNTGTSDLHIGTGPDTIILRPGESHITDGSATQIYNPSGERVLVEIREVEASKAQATEALQTTIGVVPPPGKVD